MARPFANNLAHLPVAPAAASGTLVLENDGDADAYPVWELRGPGQNFRAISPTGEVLEWLGTLEADETLVIDTQVGTAIDGAGENRYAEFGEAPRMWTIPPGESTVEIQWEGTSTGSLGPDVLLATNLVPNPSFEASYLTHLLWGPAFPAASRGEIVSSSWWVTGERASRPKVRATPASTPDDAWVRQQVDLGDDAAGRWLAFGADVLQYVFYEEDPWAYARVEIEFQNEAGAAISTVASDYRELPHTWGDEVPARQLVSAQVPEGAVTALVGVRFTDDPESPFVAAEAMFATDAWSAHLADDEASARSRAAAYFDGDTRNTSSRIYSWSGATRLSPSTVHTAKLTGASRVAVSWRARKWMVI